MNCPRCNSPAFELYLAEESLPGKQDNSIAGFCCVCGNIKMCAVCGHWEGTECNKKTHAGRME